MGLARILLTGTFIVASAFALHGLASASPDGVAQPRALKCAILHFTAQKQRACARSY